MKGSDNFPKMHKSKCKYCERGFYDDPMYGDREVEGWVCWLDEWDEFTRCTPGGCHYYTRREGEK